MQVPHILIVEDEIVTHNALKTIFAADDYSVHLAADGEKIQAQLFKQAIQLVILDLNLPGKNGLLLHGKGYRFCGDLEEQRRTQY